MSVRESFVERFGEEQASLIEGAVESHSNMIPWPQDKGSDPFKWVVLRAIGFECVTQYKEAHGITVDEGELRDWCLNEGNLSSHDGDFDFLAAFAGIYEGWVK